MVETRIEVTDSTHRPRHVDITKWRGVQGTTLSFSKEEALDLIKKLHDWVWAHMRDEKGDMPGVCPICGCCIK